MLRAIGVVALALTWGVEAIAMEPEEACGFSGVRGAIGRLMDEGSYWRTQRDRYAGFLKDSKSNVRLLLVDNEKLAASISYEMRQAVIYARSNGDDPKEAAALAKMNIIEEIRDNKEVIKDEHAQQKFYQYCIDYAESKLPK